jgi:hypothetical protein
MRPLALACLLAITSCKADRDRARPAPSVRSTTPQTTASIVATSNSAATRDVDLPTAIRSMQLHDAPRLRFKAVSETDARLRVTLAGREQPNPHRRPLAYFRLSRALDLDVVPATYQAALSFRTLREQLAEQPEALDLLRREAVISNDGTVTALLERHVAGVAAEPNDDRLARLAGIAGSSEPVAAGYAAQVRDYVTIVVLDYLAANVLRSSLMVDDRGRRVYAVDNADAFPGAVTSASLDLVLDRLKAFKRYPRGLRRSLRALDEVAARAALASNRQQDQLFGPRQLADLQDRRAALLTLLESRALQYGDHTAFSL